MPDYTDAIAIDPTGCGCTECLIGEYVPFENATIEQVRAVLRGAMKNNTHWDDRGLAAAAGISDYRSPEGLADWEWEMHADEFMDDHVGRGLYPEEYADTIRGMILEALKKGYELS